MRNKIEYTNHIFTTSDIKSVNIRLASSLISRQLEANSITAVVETGDESIQYFIRNTPMRYFHKDRQRFLAYVQSVARIGPRAYQISGTSAIGLLMERMHAGGIYNGQTAETVVREIVGGIPFAMKGNLKGIKLYGWLPYAKPPERSARDNLVQVLFAIGAALKTDLDGVLHIDPLWDGISGVIGLEKIYQGASIKRDGTVSAVSVTEHNYIAGTEEKKLFEGDAMAGDIITFSEPMHSLAATGFSILERGANYAKLSAGTGTLTGKAYIHNTRQITRTVNPGAPENAKSIDDATLVSFSNSNSVADSLAEYYKHTETISCDVVLNNQSPGDVLNVYHPYTKKAGPACVESLDISASGILKASMMALVGYKPPQTVDVEYFDKRQMFTSNTTFTVPDGVHNIRAVLIGGGTGGSGGGNGTDGTAGFSASMRGTSGSNSGSNGTPGKGGSAGVGGPGGHVNILDLSVEPGSKIVISIGAGGVGGVNGGQGSAGGPSTISIGAETYSSQNGSTSTIGYVDPTTEEVFAKSGISGGPGGDGGAAGNESGSGENGESVPGYTGGAGRASKETISSKTSTGPYVFKSYTTRTQQVGSPSTIFSIVTGYSDYRVDSEGRISTSGSSKTLGVISTGNVVTGTVYKNSTNEDTGAIRISNIEVYTVTSLSMDNQCRLTKSSIRNTRIYQQGSTAAINSILPSGGGGAAIGSNGGDATKSSAGQGANASAVSPPATPGFGGNGGHGGAGGGAGGGGHVQLIRVSAPDHSISSSQSGASGGKAGTGSAGSKGANGCVIFYFGEPQKVPSGSPVDKNQKFYLDRFGRLLVV